MDEFLVIMQVLDPSLEIEDVEDTFVEIGATDSLNEEQFWSWCTSLFGDFDDDQFALQIDEMLNMAGQQMIEGSVQIDAAEDERRAWSVFCASCCCTLTVWCMQGNKAVPHVRC